MKNNYILNRWHFITSLFCFLFVLQGIALPVAHIAIEPLDTLVQRQQDYLVADGKLVPLLEEIVITFKNKSGSNIKQKFYIKQGARELLSYLSKTERKTRLSVLSYMSQTQVIALLKAIQVLGRPAIELFDGVVGGEAIKAYSDEYWPDATTQLGKKDLELVENKAFAPLRAQLKSGDLSGLKQIEKGSNRLSHSILYLDTSAVTTIAPQRSRVVKITKIKKDQAYWSKLVSHSSNRWELNDIGLEANVFMSKNDAEASQLNNLIWLLEDAKNSQFPNRQNTWSQLLMAESALYVEKLHFNYLITDLLKKDDPNTYVLVLGRDADLYYKALLGLRNAGLKIQSPILYSPISRLVAKAPEGRLTKILEKVGIDTDALKTGKKKLRIVDFGMGGSIPKRIIEDLFNGDLDWKKNVDNITSFLFCHGIRTDLPASEFSSLEDYLNQGAFLEPSPHFTRAGREELKGVLDYLETSRPRTIIRAVGSDSDGNVLTEKAHPTEHRFAQILRRTIFNYYARPDVVELIKMRNRYSKRIKGTYPSTWTSNNETVPVISTAISEENFRGAILEQRKWVSEAHDKGILKYRGMERNFPRFIPHYRKPREETKVNWFAYQPKFAKGIEKNIVLSESSLVILPEKSFSDLSGWPKMTESIVDLDLARQTRAQGVLRLSRSAQGLHEAGTGKKLKNYGEDLANATLSSHRTNTEKLFESRGRQFENRQELMDFIQEIAWNYVEDVNPSETPNLFRTWDYRNELMKLRNKNEFHSIQDIENDYLWFIEWYFQTLQTNYDPLQFAAKIHYFFANFIHPFYDGMGKTTRDLMDFAFIRKNLQPIDWSSIAFADYYYGGQINTYAGTLELLKRIAEQKNQIAASRQPIEIKRANKNQCSDIFKVSGF